MFQHTAARRRLQDLITQINAKLRVSTHSHPKVAASEDDKEKIRQLLFQHTATRRWLRKLDIPPRNAVLVSTHSHPKVAAIMISYRIVSCSGFNTQPPEGGCSYVVRDNNGQRTVSTHSHPKVAATAKRQLPNPSSFNTQPPEGGCRI